MVIVLFQTIYTFLACSISGFFVLLLFFRHQNLLFAGSRYRLSHLNARRERFNVLFFSNNSISLSILSFCLGRNQYSSCSIHYRKYDDELGATRRSVYPGKRIAGRFPPSTLSLSCALRVTGTKEDVISEWSLLDLYRLEYFELMISNKMQINAIIVIFTIFIGTAFGLSCAWHIMKIMRRHRKNR